MDALEGNGRELEDDIVLEFRDYRNEVKTVMNVGATRVA